MRLAIFFVAVAFSQVAGSTTPAQMRESFSCDSPGGRFDSYNRELGGQSFRLTANVTINEFRQNERWLPAVNIYLNSNLSAKSIGVRFVVDKASKRAIILATHPGQKGKLGDRIAEAAIGEVVPIRIDSEPGKGTISVGDVSRLTEGNGGSDLQVSLSCSSLDAHIDDIRISTVQSS
jgi:hypothetical protein